MSVEASSTRPDDPRAWFSKRELIALAAIAMTIVAAMAFVLSSLALDDAYITYRYAQHLAEGYGFGAWNHTGPRVEGYSSPLWVVLLAGAARFGADPQVASKVLSLVAALVMLAVLFRQRDDSHAILTGVFLTLYLPFILYTTSGMEAVVFTSLVTLALIGPAEWQPFVAPLLIATRPEGALVAGINVLTMPWRGDRWRSVVATAITTGLMFALIVGHRWLTYGVLAPNTYYAKVAGGGIGHVLIGLVYVGGWMLTHIVLVAFLGIGAVAVARAGDRRGQTCLLLLVAYVVYMASAGGDPPSAFPLWRQFIHIAPAWLLVTMTGVVSLVGARRWRQVGVAVGLALAADAGVLIAQVQSGSGPRPGVADYNAWMASISDSTTTIASSYGGALPYVVDAVHIDVLGLSTAHIARHGTFDPDGPQDSKSDMRWVMDQGPDIVEGYVSGSALLRGASAEEVVGERRRKMILEMLTSPRFQREYVFVRNAPYDRLDRAVFLRRDFWEAHPQRSSLDCVPVSETILASFATR